MSDMIIVNSVKVDASGIRNVFLDEAVGEALERECAKKHRELEATCAGMQHSPKGSPNFAHRVKRMPNCLIGIIVPLQGSGRKGRGGSAPKTSVALEINKKHNFIHW